MVLDQFSRSATAVTTEAILSGERRIVGVAHDHDGYWQFLDGEDVADGVPSVLHLGHIVDSHPEVRPLLDLPLGWQAWRSRDGSDWKRSPIVPEA